MPKQLPPKSLPAYDRPPVVETILGVQFDQMPNFKTVHLGAFWKILDPVEWPTVLDAPPVAPQFEQFGESIRWGTISQLVFAGSGPLGVRTQIKNRTNDRMIQIQNGRLHFNWLNVAGNPYAHYADIRAGFLSAFERFLAFVRSENLGELRPNQWEVTYLNHIPRGTVWNEPKDWGFFRPINSNPLIEEFSQAESIEGEWHFVLPEERGRLHVAWQHGRKPEQNEPLILLTLTARGPLNTGEASEHAVVDGLDFGRETIVRSFEKLMSNEANKYWGLRNAGS